MSDQLQQEFDVLVTSYLDGELDEAGFRQLESMLAKDPQNVKQFVAYVVDHNRATEILGKDSIRTIVSDDQASGGVTDFGSQPLEQALGMLAELEASADDPRLVDLTEQVESRARRASTPSVDFRLNSIDRQPVVEVVIPRWVAYGAVAAVVLLGISLVSVFLPSKSPAPIAVSPQPTEDDPAPLVIHDAAQITDSNDAVWGSDVEVGTQLSEGTRLELRGGYAELTFQRGAVLTLEAPCTIEVLDDNAVRVERGTLTASVPPSAHLFAVQTPTAHIIDYGTVFGVDVDETGATDAAVISGEIELSEIADASDSPARNIRLTEGWASRVDSQGDLARTPKQFSPVGQHRFVVSVDETKEPGFGYRQAVLEDKPMVYWRFDTKGVRIKNEAGQRRWDGRRIGKSEIEEGLFGGALALAGDLKAMGGAQSLQRLDFEDIEAYTLELWCWADAAHHGRLMGLDFLDRKTGGVYPVTMAVLETLGPQGFQGNAKTVRLLHRDPPGIDSTTGTNIFSKTPYPTGRWTHIVAVKTVERMQIYIDGELTRELHDTQTVDQDLSPDLVVGVSSTMHNDSRINNKSVHRPFDGLIDEVAVYGHELSADQIKNHFALGNPDAEAAPEE